MNLICTKRKVLFVGYIFQITENKNTDENAINKVPAVPPQDSGTAKPGERSASFVVSFPFTEKYFITNMCSKQNWGRSNSPAAYTFPLYLFQGLVDMQQHVQLAETNIIWEVKLSDHM